MNRVLLIVWGLTALTLMACNNTSGNGDAGMEEDPTDTTVAAQSVQKDTAASEAAGQEAMEASPIESREWSVMSFTFEGQQYKPAGEVTPMLRLASGRLTGTTGCNHFNAPYELGEGNSLSVGNIATTKKMCSNIVPQERRLLELLRNASGYELLSRKVMEIRSGKGKITVTAEQAMEGDY